MSTLISFSQEISSSHARGKGLGSNRSDSSSSVSFSKFTSLMPKESSTQSSGGYAFLSSKNNSISFNDIISSNLSESRLKSPENKLKENNFNNSDDSLVRKNIRRNDKVSTSNNVNNGDPVKPVQYSNASSSRVNIETNSNNYQDNLFMNNKCTSVDSETLFQTNKESLDNGNAIHLLEQIQQSDPLSLSMNLFKQSNASILSNETNFGSQNTSSSKENVPGWLNADENKLDLGSTSEEFLRWDLSGATKTQFLMGSPDVKKTDPLGNPEPFVGSPQVTFS